MEERGEASVLIQREGTEQIWHRLLGDRKTPDDVQRVVEARRGSSLLGACANFLKGMMGAGLLSLPGAFYLSGLLTGIATFAFIIVLCLTSYILITKCKREANKKLSGDPFNGPVITFLDLATVASPKLQLLTSIFVVLCSVTCCIGWVIIINNNLSQYFPSYLPSFFPVLIAFPVLLTLSWMRYMKYLVPVSYVGCATYAVGVVGLSAAYALGGGPAPHSEWITRFNLSDLPIFFSQMLYPFATFIAIPSLIATLRTPRHDVVLVSTSYPLFALIAAAYAAAAAAAGLGVCPVVLDCLPPHGATQATQITLALVMILTFPLGLTYSFDTIEVRCFTPRTKLRWLLAERAALCVAACAIGSLVPNFSIFTSFVSPLLFSVLGFVLPPLFYLKIKEWKNVTIVVRVLCVLMIAFGMSYTFLGTIQAIRNVL